jgi:hypothetical protein
VLGQGLQPFSVLVQVIVSAIIQLDVTENTIENVIQVNSINIQLLDKNKHMLKNNMCVI